MKYLGIYFDNSFKYLQTIVCDYYKTRSYALFIRTREREIVECRYIIMVLLDEYFRLKNYEVSGLFGLNHAVIHHARKVVKNLIATNKTFRKSYKEFEFKLINYLEELRYRSNHKSELDDVDIETENILSGDYRTYLDTLTDLLDVA